MEKMPKNAKKFICKECDFVCYKHSNFDKHILTSKHKNRTILNDFEQKMPKNAAKLFQCECGKKYSVRNSLWYHKQKCQILDNCETEECNNKKADESSDKDNLIMMLIKQNAELIKETTEFKNMMMDVIKTGTHNTTNNNSHNKAFNLNFFLNETCKDAMNITDFVESIKLQLSDLERVGEIGYVEGISNIIVKNLKGLDVTQRPVHCTDKKRETMYIKDENKWEKDEEQKKMHKMVRKVADKNARMLPKFKEAHPDCIKSNSLYSDQYNQIIMEAMGGKGDNDFEKEEKIIKKVSKEVMVEKEPY
jgi:hypothetical protein